MTNNDFTTVKDFGAIGDGVANDTAALRAAFKSTTVTGKTLYIPSGVYMVHDMIGVSITSNSKDIGIFCDPGTVIKAANGFPIGIKLINFLAPDPNPNNPDVAKNIANISLKWVGGTIDGRNMPKGGVEGKAPDGLTVGGGKGHINNVEINNLKIILNDTRETLAADSCLMINANDIHITNCIFQGAVDCGMYLSGDATQTNGVRCYVSGNTFLECGSGLVSKRSYQYHIITGNFFENCGNGCVVGGGADKEKLPGRKAIIANNILKNVNRGLELRVSDNSIITGNRIEDYGITDETTSTEGAILITGSNNCIVSNNITTFSGEYTPNPASVAVRINSYTYNNINYSAKYNLITNNIFNSPPNAIKCSVEERATVPDYTDYNVINNNLVVGFKQHYKVIGPNSNKSLLA